MEEWDNREEILKMKQRLISVEAVITALEETLETIDVEIRELINIATINSEVEDKIVKLLKDIHGIKTKPGRDIPKSRKLTKDKH